MSSIFGFQPSKTRPFPIKTRVIWVPVIHIHSLKLTAKAPENCPGPKRQGQYSNHTFSGALASSFREGVYIYISIYLSIYLCVCFFHQLVNTRFLNHQIWSTTTTSWPSAAHASAETPAASNLLCVSSAHGSKIMPRGKRRGNPLALGKLNYPP